MDISALPDRVVKAQTGLSIEKLQALLPAFEAACEDLKILKGRGQNPDRPGRRLGYDRYSCLVYVLTFMKNNLTFDACAAFFDVPRSTMYYLIRTGLNALECALDSLGRAPLTDVKSAVEALVILGKNETIKIDATERPIQRPKEYQEAYYSGKKSTHPKKPDCRRGIQRNSRAK